MPHPVLGQGVPCPSERKQPRQDMIRRMATLMGGSVAGQLVSVLAAFALTRLYSPEAFAHLEMFALVTGIGAVLGTGKFEQALMLPKQEGAARSLLWAGQRSVGYAAVLTAIIAWPTAAWVSREWALEQWSMVALFLPVFVAFAAHTRLLEYWHHRQANAGPVALANGGAPFAAESGKLAGSLMLPLSGLVWGSGLGLITRWAIMRRGLKEVCQSAGWRRSEPEPGTSKAHRDYPTWVLAGSAMNRLAQWLHVLLLGIALGPVLLGMLGLARRTVMQPLSILAASAAPVLFQSATEMADGAPLRRLFWKALATFAALSFMVWLVVMAAPDNTTAWLFGDQWFGVMEVVRLLVPWFALNFMTAGLGSMFHRVHRPRWITALDALHLLAVGTGWWLGTLHPEWFGGGEWGALVGIVWAKCGYYLVNVTVLIFAVMTHGNADR